MNYYEIWVTERDQRNEALQNAERQRLAKQILPERPLVVTSFSLSLNRIISLAGFIVSIILALLGWR